MELVFECLGVCADVARDFSPEAANNEFGFCTNAVECLPAWGFVDVEMSEVDTDVFVG